MQQIIRSGLINIYFHEHIFLCLPADWPSKISSERIPASFVFPQLKNTFNIMMFSSARLHFSQQYV